MTEGHTLRVLIVCEANQCRSRVAEALLQHALADCPQIEVASAGSKVGTASPLCIAADEFIHANGTQPQEGRWSTALTESSMREAALILAADSLVRSDIVALDPDSRGRTFTLLQAAAAATHLLDQGVVAHARQAHRDGQTYATEEQDDEVVVIAAALHAGNCAEWLRQELAAAHAFAPADMLDIPDVHTDPRAQHRRSLDLVARSIHPLATLLRQLLEPQ